MGWWDRLLQWIPQISWMDWDEAKAGGNLDIKQTWKKSGLSRVTLLQIYITCFYNTGIGDEPSPSEDPDCYRPDLWSFSLGPTARSYFLAFLQLDVASGRWESSTFSPPRPPGGCRCPGWPWTARAESGRASGSLDLLSGHVEQSTACPTICPTIWTLPK